MKLLLVSDSHTIKQDDFYLIRGLRDDICDGVVFLGDIQKPVLELFCNKFANQFKIGVLGNHDSFGEFNGLPITNIHKGIYEEDDITFAGYEGSLKYKNVHYPAYTQGEVSNDFRSLPQVDILITHNSPYGINERPDRDYEGFKGVRDYLETHNPVYHFHGHQHINKTTILNNKTTVTCVYGISLFDVLTGDNHLLLEWE